MKDLLKQQEEQPWLISPEARVPAMNDPVVDESLSPEKQRKKRQVSLQLRQDLERKLKSAAAWGEKHGEEGKTARRKKTSESDASTYCSMLSFRTR